MAQSRKVLLVDDHELVRIGVKTTYGDLLDIAIEWVEAVSLHDALEAYRRHADFDAVLLDLNLGDCKGLQGLRLFMQAHPLARVAVFSGTHDEFVIRQARALGAAAYIGKGSMTAATRDTLLALLGLLDTLDGRFIRLRVADPATEPLEIAHRHEPGVRVRHQRLLR